MSLAITQTKLRQQFFDYLFGEEVGYVCIAHAEPHNKKSFTQKFFEWPKQKRALSNHIEKMKSGHNMWFCVNLLKKAERKKEECLPTNLVWSDLDTCPPDIVEPTPQCLMQSSPSRFQALWRLDSHVAPEIAEFYSKKIAYTYSDNGADKSGWDLTQLLRVPFTYNYKYQSDENPPQVELLQSLETLIPVTIFEALPAPSDAGTNGDGTDDEEIPENLPEVQQVLYKYSSNLRESGFADLYAYEPTEGDDWSRLLWRLVNLCLEAGMDRSEAFVVCQTSNVNKYERDNRPARYLWREILKAEKSQQNLELVFGPQKSLAMPDLVDSSEKDDNPFIKDYVEWASISTDAIPQYHELSAFMLLSTVVGGSLKLKTSYGDMIPNLWGLILGDSTLTRKTTAMRMAMDLIYEIDPEFIVATDGSAEGLLTGLSTRPNQVSIFYKDEVSGFFDSINKKDYLAGMPETLTHLYDVPKIFTRRLRKDTITISSPVFIFYGGGIRDKVYSILSDEYVLSGFLPRFLVVSGEADLSKIRRTGPATDTGVDTRARILSKLADLYESYKRTEIITIAGQEVEVEAGIEAYLTNEAWERYGEIEFKMVEAATESPISMLALPTFERLSRSLLKMSILLASTRQDPDNNTIQADTQDVISAARYIQQWGVYSVDLIQNAGKRTTERIFDRVLSAIEKTPGIARSTIMQHHHLTKREADEVFSTLADRGLIRMEKAGRGARLWKI